MLIYTLSGAQPRNVEYIVGHSAAEVVDATTELFPKTVMRSQEVPAIWSTADSNLKMGNMPEWS